MSNLINRHVLYTGSRVADDITNDFAAALRHFVKVFPKEYQRALGELAAKGSKLAA